MEVLESQESVRLTEKRKDASILCLDENPLFQLKQA